MDDAPGAVKTGTSTVGITFKGGVVVGADHRATMGHFVANKSVQKLFKIGDNLALTTAGLVGHAQSLASHHICTASTLLHHRSTPSIYCFIMRTLGLEKPTSVGNGSVGDRQKAHV